MSQPYSVNFSLKELSVESANCAKGVEPLDKEECDRVLRKVDWHLLPFVSLLYLLCFLDRSSIANAKIAGMATDLNLIGLRYNTAAAIFFIPYCLGQIPSNITLKLFRPSRWIPVIMVAWGLVMTLMCLVSTYQGLLVARVFLGLAESGLFPGVTYYLSRWYPRAEQAKRIAIFCSAATVAGAFGGLLARRSWDRIGGLHGWQWIFCLEGLTTVVIAFAGFFIMHDYPETASFLTETERRCLVQMMKADSQHLATHFHFRYVLQALKDYKIYLQFGILIGAVIPAYTTTLFTTTIINDLGFSAANAQLLSVPIFVFACVCTIIIGTYSDKYRRRGPFALVGQLTALVGYIVLYTQTQAWCIVLVLAWVSSNAGGDMKRGTALGAAIGFANLGGICSSFIYFDPPRFHIGHGTMMGWLSLSILLNCFSMWNYNRLNKQKEKECLERGIQDSDDQKEEFKDDGDESPLFRYAI
ncbi:major facilitator superfamily domain-containing protein [Chiua virens]|nr:major facilitator superfamily domain-containing protein [Chiua virens]